jgi:hypothetical protein
VATSRFLKIGVILADSSATLSNNASCFSRLPDIGTSAERSKYGEMSAVRELRRDEREGETEVDAVKSAGDGSPID